VLHSLRDLTFSTNHVQLRKLIEAGVSQEELQQILSQLRTLVRGSAPPAPSAPPVQWQAQPSYQAPPPMQPPFPPTAQIFTQPPSMPYHVDASETVNPDSKSSSQAATSPSTSAGPPQSNIANLLSTLLKAGVVSAGGTPLGAGATTKEDDTKQPSMESVDLERESCRAYRQAILSQQIQLTSSDITK
jgi:pre-mRNA cleavage complex 2 protein Pcf11